MAARATVSNVVGMIGTEASLSVQTATMKVQRCVFPTTFSADSFPTFSHHGLLSVNLASGSARQGRRVAHPGCVHISLGIQCLISLSDGLVGIPSLSATPSQPKFTCAFNRACACTGHTQPYHAIENRPSPSPLTNCTRDAERRPGRASCGPLLPLYHELFRLDLW
jgi:hypothetical protein